MERVIEFQLSAVKLIDLVRHRLLEEDICVPELTDPLDGEAVILDHVEFLEGTLRRDPDGTASMQLDGGSFEFSPVQIVIPMRMFIKSATCIKDPNCGQEEYKQYPLGITPTLTVIVTLSAQGSNICGTFDGVELLGVPASFPLPGGLEAPVCSAFPLASLATLLGTQPIVVNSVLSANDDLTVLALRIECAGPVSNPLTLASWKAFCNGQIGPSVVNKDWSLFVGRRLITDGIASQFAASLAETEGFQVEKGPSANWLPPGFLGGDDVFVMVTFSGQVDVDECPNTIGVDPATVVVKLSVDGSSPNVVKSHASLFTDLVDSDVVLCAASYGGPIGLAVNVWLGIVIMGAIVAAASIAEPDEEDLSLPKGCTATSDTEFDCTREILLPPIRLSKNDSAFSPSGTLTLDTMSGTWEGAVFGGPCAVPAVVQKGTLQVASEGFTFGVTGDCNTPQQIGYSCIVKGAGRHHCQDIVVIDDHLHMFAPVPKRPQPGQDLTVAFPMSGDIWDPPSLTEYFADPYPCRLVIRSSVGSRCLEIAAPSAPTGGPDEWKEELLKAALENVIHCTKLVHPYRFLPWWLGDPQLPVQVVYTDPRREVEQRGLEIRDLSVEFSDDAEFVRSGSGWAAKVPIRVRANGRVHVESYGEMRVAIDEELPAEFAVRAGQRGRVDVSVKEIVKRVEGGVQKLPDGIGAISTTLNLNLAYGWGKRVGSLT